MGTAVHCARFRDPGTRDSASQPVHPVLLQLIVAGESSVYRVAALKER
jgi:hypothetical protein